MLKFVQSSRDSRLELVVAYGWQAARLCTQVKHAEKMNSHANWSIIGQKVQSGNFVCSQLELATQSSREAKSPTSSVLKNLTLRIPFSLQYKYPSYPWNIESFQREYWERNLEKTRLTHPQSSHIDSSNSSTLIISIVISLRGSLPKYFLTIPTSVRRPFSAWEAIRKGPISYWLMLWFIAESGKLKKK